MSKAICICVLLSFLLFIPACKSNQSSAPQTPAPTAQAITVIASSNMLYIGASETFTATAQMSDGTTKAVTGGVWGGDNPNVATVQSSGNVTIVGSGMVSIYVDYQGRRGSIVIRGLPNYQGTWSGSYIITSCTNTGDWKGWCKEFPNNRVFPTNLNLTQDEDRVDGRCFLGTLAGDTSGPVQVDGQLMLTGAIYEGVFTCEVAWNLQSATPGRITGALSQYWRGTGYSGNAYMTANIRDLNRTSNMMVLPAHGELRLMNPTIEDLIRAIMVER